MSLHAQIETLLGELVILSAEETKNILLRCANAQEGELAGLLGVLKEAKATQDQMMKKLVTVDPDFPKKLEQHLRQFTQSLKPEIEAREAKESAAAQLNLDS